MLGEQYKFLFIGYNFIIYIANVFTVHALKYQPFGYDCTKNR